MSIEMFFVLYIGCFVDSLFLTILYFKQKRINIDWSLIALMTVGVVAINIYCVDLLRLILIVIYLIVTMLILTKDKLSIAYICSFILIDFLIIDSSIYYMVGSNYVGLFSAIIVKLFLINTMKNEYNHSLKFNFLNITLKMFFVLFCFFILSGDLILIGVRW